MGISPQQFEKMKSRMEGGSRSTPAQDDAETAAIKSAKVILGVDPSLRGTGYGIIGIGAPYANTLAQGTIKCPQSWVRTRCLAKIATTLRDVIREHSPDVCAIEGLFFAQNLKTALTMGEARGASLVAAAEAGLDIFEIAPRKVKQAIVGYGAAQKIAVAKMVQRMLNLAELPDPDAADALALALAHAQEISRTVLNPLKKI